MSPATATETRANAAGSGAIGEIGREDPARTDLRDPLGEGPTLGDPLAIQRMPTRAARPAAPGRALQARPAPSGTQPIQRQVYDSFAAMWAAVAPTQRAQDIEGIIAGNGALSTAYQEMAGSLARMNFVAEDGRQPEASLQANDNGTYNIYYGTQATQRGDYRDANRFAGAIIHEMMHIHAALAYQTNTPQGMAHGANMHLPAPQADEERHMPMGVSDSQYNGDGGIAAQVAVMDANWERARQEVALDEQSGAITEEQADLFRNRITYAEGIAPFAHYDTVLVDVLYYLEGNGLQQSRTYEFTTRMLEEANARRGAGEGTVGEIARAPLPQQQQQQAQPQGDDEAQQRSGLFSCCYITTACVEHKGLADDCEILTVLRRFRDGYLLSKPNGRQLVDFYYAHSPAVVAGIRRERDEDEILDGLFVIVESCVAAIRAGEPERAYEAYCRMFVSLTRRYAPHLVIPAY